MSLKDAWKRDKFAGVWRWATHGKGPNVNRWERTVEWSRSRVNQFKKGVREKRRELKFVNEHIKKHSNERKRLQVALKKAQAENNDVAIERLQKKLAENHRESKDLRMKRRRILDTKKQRVDQVKFWLTKNTVYRKKYKAAKKKAEQESNNGGSPSQPTFQAYMANGYNWIDSNQWVRDACARWVVLDGNYTTSLARNYVPPGGSTTSHHLFGRAGDCGPSSTTQNREFQRGLGDPHYYELYGPSNVQNLRYGAQLTQAEGSSNETLHDSHNHLAGSY